jgi:putative DNA primase/helicase
VNAKAVPMSSVRRQRPEWVERGLIPKHTVTMLAGEEGLGKGLYCVRLAARLSREGLNTLFLVAEDSPAMILRPRLEAAEADLGRVFIYQLDDGLGLGGLRLPDDGDQIKALAVETSAELVVIDPLVAHLGRSVNSWNDHATRIALAPLYGMADELGCAALGILHLNKRASDESRSRIGGSTAFRALARSVLLLARDPDDAENGSRRILAHDKCNVGELAASQQFEILTVDLPSVDGQQATETAKLEYCGVSTQNARQLLSGVTGEDRDAAEFLRELLSRGPVRAPEVFAQGAEAGFSEGQLKRAKKRAHAKSRKLGMDGGHVWELIASNGALFGMNGNAPAQEVTAA